MTGFETIGENGTPFMLYTGGRFLVFPAGGAVEREMLERPSPAFMSCIARARATSVV